MVYLTKELSFPDPRQTTKDGLVAIGGDLSSDRLLLAYRSGIFPWFIENGEPFWFCPPMRMVLFPQEVSISRTMKRLLRSNKFRVTEDLAFEDVIRSCAEVHEGKEGSTWINDEFISAYIQFHRLGYAHSIEVWNEKKLAGGMYGVTTGKLFCGESMFSRMANASKVALIHVCQSGKYGLIDCQVPTDHLASMGARLVSREEFLKLLRKYR